MNIKTDILENDILWLAVLVVIILIVIAGRIYNRFNRPKEKTFRCGRCGKFDEHNSRTINAWRDGKKKYFCRACHKIWLESKPNRQQPAYKQQNPSYSSGRGGCFPILIIGSILVFGSINAIKTKSSNQILDPTWTTPVLKAKFVSQAGQD